jgi:hypothetical protein
MEVAATPAAMPAPNTGRAKRIQRSVTPLRVAPAATAGRAVTAESPAVESP